MVKENTVEKEVKKAGLLALVAAAGAAVGGALGLIFAPQSGKKTRADIKKTLDDAEKEIKERADQVQDLTAAQYQKIVDEVIDKYEVVKDLGDKEVIKIKKELGAKYPKAKPSSKS